jgi:hypothetical protein
VSEPGATPAAVPRAIRKGPLHCKDCPMWYGAEDDGWGPCSIKHRRGDRRYLTWGGHECDEGYVPPTAAPVLTRADELSGHLSTSRPSAVGYTSISKAGQGRRRAARRRTAGASSTRRRSGSKR